MVEILLIVLPVFLVIGLGLVMKGTGLVDPAFLGQLNRLVYYVPLPIMFFYKIAQSDFSASFNLGLLLVLMSTVVAVGGLSYLYTGIRGYDATTRGAFSQASFRGNLVYIGLPIIYSAYGEAGFAVAGILIGFITPLVNFLSIVVLRLPQQGHDHAIRTSFWLHQVANNPLIIASFLGIAWSVFKLPIPAVLAESFEIISGMTMPLALVVIGASFSFKELRGDMIITLSATSFKLLLLPFMVGLVLLLLGVGGMELGVGILLAATPTASAAYVMAQQLESDGDLTSSIIMFSTLVSIVSYTFYLYLLKTLGI